MVEYVSAIYNLARVTKVSEFSIVIHRHNGLLQVHVPKGNFSVAQGMAICIHQTVLDMALSSGATHWGDVAVPAPLELRSLVLAPAHL
jgi:hypothetical protein